jgi:uracil-DNA glycosylase family 4
MTNLITDPDHDCEICPRLRTYILETRAKYPDWFNGPVPTWLPPDGAKSVKMLIVGLAPGIRGANRTGRPFTGDYAGDLLYATLKKFGFSEGEYHSSPDDGLTLKEAAITNAVRCVPPENKPVGQEINNCRPFLEATLSSYTNLKAIVTLGKISHDSTIRTLNERVSQHPFGHNKVTQVGRLKVFSSYHCSRYNTNTGRLTEKMFETVFRSVRNYIDSEAK